MKHTETASAYLSADKDTTDAYFGQFYTVSHNAEDTPQPIPDLNGEVQTTPGYESSLQARFQTMLHHCLDDFITAGPLSLVDTTWPPSWQHAGHARVEHKCEVFTQLKLL